jgi:hypothetical protein
VIQVRHGDDIALGAFVADETGGDELAFFDVAVENRAGYRRFDDRIVELVLRIGQSAARLLDLAADLIDFLFTGPENG